MSDIVEVEYRQIGKDELSYQWHTHVGICEIIQIWSNEGTVLMRDKVYPMRAGTVFLINGMENHCTSPEDLDTYQRSKVVVSYEFMKSVANIAKLDNVFYYAFETGERTCFEMSMEWSIEADGIFKKMKAAYDSEDEYKSAKMVSLLIELIMILCRHRTYVETAGNSRLAEIILYINNHLDEEITIDNICRHMSISKYYLCHMFKKEVNMTISQYILQRRLSVARRRLLDTEDTISEVASKTGFASFSYFSRVFREEHGCSPREFRRQVHTLPPAVRESHKTSVKQS